jgi:hypothetical protein
MVVNEETVTSRDGDESETLPGSVEEGRKVAGM